MYARHHFTVKSWLRAFCKLVSAQFQFGRERNQLMVNFSLGELEIFVIPQRLRSLLLLLWRISDIRLNWDCVGGSTFLRNIVNSLCQSNHQARLSVKPQVSLYQYLIFLNVWDLKRCLTYRDRQPASVHMIIIAYSYATERDHYHSSSRVERWTIWRVRSEWLCCWDFWIRSCQQRAEKILFFRVCFKAKLTYYIVSYLLTGLNLRLGAVLQKHLTLRQKTT